jgi:hypothetical protein
MMLPFWSKMYVKPGMNIHLVHPPSSIQALMSQESELRFDRNQPASFVLWFIASKADFHHLIETELSSISPLTRLWIAYPKQSANSGADIHRDSLDELAKAHRLRAFRQIAIDSIWSALGFHVE